MYLYILLKFNTLCLTSSNGGRKQMIQKKKRLKGETAEGPLYYQQFSWINKEINLP